MLAPVSEVIIGAPAGPVPGAVRVGGSHPLALIAGPCVIESFDRADRICGSVSELCARLGLPFIFKASFDKANRSSLHSFRGPGLEEGLEILAAVREKHGVAVTTDVHLPEQAERVAATVDLLQVPAFLCRQTDLLVACAGTGRPVNIKKGQFMAPGAMASAVAKLVGSGAQGVIVTERGTTFGYGDLVVDMRALPIIRGLGVPVCFDATHSVQRPPADGQTGRTGGDRGFIQVLARAAVGAGIDALFLEVHDDPDSSPSDGPNMVPLDQLEALLRGVLAIDRGARS